MLAMMIGPASVLIGGVEGASGSQNSPAAALGQGVDLPAFGALDSGAGDASSPAPADVRDGLAEEPPSATVSVLVRLRGATLSDLILDYRSQFGLQGSWGPAVLESARAALDSRDAAMDGQRVRVFAPLERAGVAAFPARDYRYLVNGLNLRDVPAFVVPLLASNAEVLFVERDHQVSVDLAQSVPIINADDVWNLTDGLGRNITGEGTLVANIDTGVDYTHPDLGGTLNRTNDLANLTSGSHSKFAAGWDFVNNDSDPWDGHLHGTHVAGIIGANGTIRGVAPWAKQLALKVLSDGGSGSDSDIIAAMEYATDPDGNPLTNDAANASSLSLGGWDPDPDGLSPLAADASTRLGTICVIAAGNSGATNSVGSPGVSREAITVGSTNKSDMLSVFSSRGPTLALDIKPDILAPGSSITSTRWGGAGGNLTISGTSMATPHVSGAIALLAQAHPTWGVNATRSALVDTAVDLGYGVYQQGGGRIDVLAALNTAVVATPHKLAMGRLPRLTNGTNATLEFENLGGASETLNFSAVDLFGMFPEMTYTGNATDLNFVSVTPANLTLAAGARGNVTVVFAPSSSAVPGLYWGNVIATGGNLTLRIPLAYAVRAPVLLVDDDSSERYPATPAFDNFAGFPSASNNVSWSLTRLGVKHDIYTAKHYTDNGAPLADLVNYPLVIWCTGYDYDYSDGYHTHRSISSADRVALSAYLDRGGQLWLIGENIAWDVFGHTNTTVSSSNFFNAYLGVARVDNELNTPNPLNGTPGTFMEGASYTTAATWTEFGNAGDYATHLTPTSRAFTIFNGSTTDVYGTSYSNASLAVAVDNDTYRSVFWGVEFSWLGNSAQSDDAVSRTLQFFAPRVTLMNATAGEGDTLDFRGYYAFLPNESLFTLAWSFGDGGVAATRNATHTFADEGTFSVRFTVTSGAWLNRSGILNVTVVNLAPVLGNLSAAPTAPFEGDVVNFTATCSDPGPLDVVAYAWSFGDGSQNATGNATSHTYADEGNYTLSLTCSDGDGGIAMTNVTLTIANAAPQINWMVFAGNLSEGRPISFNGSCQDPGSNDVISFAWSFGDGSADGAGTNQTHVFEDDGNYTVTLTCSDSDGGTVTQQLVLTISNVAPAVGLSGPLLITEGAPFSLNATVTDPGTRDTFAYAWDFGDGTPLNGSPGATHRYADNGIFTVMLTVTDNSGGIGRADFIVVVQNVAPTAVINLTGEFIEGSDFTYTVEVFDPGSADTHYVTWDAGAIILGWRVWADDGTFTFNMTVIDDDGMGTSYPFTVTIANFVPSLSLGSRDISADEGERIFFSASVYDRGPMDRMVVTVNFGDGTPLVQNFIDDWRFNGSMNFGHTFVNEGNYTITVTVDDGDGGVNATSWVVAVLNAAPSLSLGPSPLVVDQGETVGIVASVSDPGRNDVVTISWSFSDRPTILEGPNITLVFARRGTYYVDVTATDDAGASTTETVEVQVLNVAPSIAVEAPGNVTEGEENGYQATTSDPGPLDRVSVVWEWGDGSSSSGSDVLHTFADVGRYVVTVTATDDYGASTNGTFVIDVQNAPPVVLGIYALEFATEGGPVQFGARIANPADEPLTYLWNFGDGAESTETAPSHTYADDGEYPVRVTVTDPEGASSSLETHLGVPNANPSLECMICPVTVAVGSAFPILVNGSDAGIRDRLTYQARLPDGTTFDSLDGAFSVTLDSPGIVQVLVSVFDEDGGSANATLEIHVLPDFDGDAVPDVDDPDDDNDGSPDAFDPAPFDPSVVAPPVSTPAGLPFWLLLLLAAAGMATVFFLVRRSRRRPGE